MAKHRPGRALKEALNWLFKKPATILYPFEKTKIAERYRGRIEFDAPKCIGCKMCMRDCPAKAIEIIKIEEKPAEGAPPETPAKKRFECVIHMDHCVYCGQCIDSCPKKALFSSTKHYPASTTRKDLSEHYGKPA